MDRQAPGAHDHQVQASAQAGQGRIPARDQCQGAGDAQPLSGRNGIDGGGQTAPGLDLDGDENIAAPDHQIDLPGRRAFASGEDPIALQAQPEGGPGLRRQAPGLGAPAPPAAGCRDPVIFLCLSNSGLSN